MRRKEPEHQNYRKKTSRRAAGAPAQIHVGLEEMTSELEKLDSNLSRLPPSDPAMPGNMLRLYEDAKLIDRHHFAGDLETGASFRQVAKETVDSQTIRGCNACAPIGTYARFMTTFVHCHRLQRAN